MKVRVHRDNEYSDTIMASICRVSASAMPSGYRHGCPWSPGLLDRLGNFSMYVDFTYRQPHGH
jgi:hypothetical protein